MADLNYLLAPWQWVTEDDMPFWSAPAGTAGLVDLRSINTQSLAGTQGDRPYGFFCVDPSLAVESEAALLGRGDCRDLLATTTIREVWESLLGYRPNGERLVDLLFDQLTNGSINGDSEPVKPLMPGTANDLLLSLGGHSVVKQERFRFGIHPHTEKVQEALRQQFEKHFHAVDRGEMRANQHRRILDFWLDKYRIPRSEWARLVPPHLRRHIDGPLPHATTISDDFNRADSGTLDSSSEGWSWTEVEGDWSIVSNEANIAVGTGSLFIAGARAESDLSSDDHSATAEVTYVAADSAAGGPACRFNASANTYYRSGAHRALNQDRIFKIVNGSQSKLADQSNTIDGTPQTVVHTIDGSTVSVTVGGNTELSVTDTAIAGNVRCGIAAFTSGGSHRFDDFTASDLGGGGATTMVAETGIFSLSGQQASLTRSLKLEAANGSYALSGQAASLTVSRKMTADSGSFTVSGQTANLLRSLKVIAANGAYSLNGQQANLTRQLLLNAESGSFALSGQAADLTKALRLVAAVGTFTASGQAADLLRSLKLAAASGSCTLSGQDATLTKSSATTLTADSGSFALSGQSADLLRSIVMAATQGTYALNGQAAILTKTSAAGDIVFLELSDGSLFIGSLGA